MGGQERRFDVGNLPRDIVIYTDRCGVDFVHGADSWDLKVAQLGVAKNFYEGIRGCNNIWINQEVYKEFGGIIGYFAWKEKECGELCDGSFSDIIDEEKFYIAFEGRRLYNQLRFKMRNNYGGIERVRNNVPLSDVEKFLDGYFYVDEGERGLLLDMFLHEDESGFLSGDGDALDACGEGLEEFNLSGRVYDARKGVVKVVSSRGRIYNCV